MVKAYLNNFFWLFLTYLSAPYLYFRIFLRKRRNTPLKVLVIQTAKIGDLVCSTPVFREIKKKFPDSYLTALIVRGTKDILKNNPRLDEVILLNDYSRFQLIQKLTKAQYDWAFNLLPGSFNNIVAFWSLIPNRVSTIHKKAGEITRLFSFFNNYRLEYQSHTRLTKHYLNLLKFIGIEGASEEKEVFSQPAEEKKVLDFLSKNNLSFNNLLVGVGVVPGNKVKQWDLSKFAVLSDRLVKELGAKIVFIGSPNDQSAIKKVQDMMQGDSLDSTGHFALFELPALLKKMNLFISSDSGPLYIANALQTPVVDIGGPLDVREQSPTGPQCRVLRGDSDSSLSCTFADSCNSACLKWFRQQLQAITPEEVFQAVSDLIGKINKNGSV